MFSNSFSYFVLMIYPEVQTVSNVTSSIGKNFICGTRSVQNISSHVATLERMFISFYTTTSPVVHLKSERNSCVKSGERELERNVRTPPTLTSEHTRPMCVKWAWLSDCRRVTEIVTYHPSTVVLFFKVLVE